MSRRKGLINWGKLKDNKPAEKPSAYGDQKLGQSVMSGTLSSSTMGGMLGSSDLNYSSFTDGSPYGVMFQANL